MNPHTNGATESTLDAPAIATPATVETRPLYWSVRRELWENRSIYLAPLAVAAVFMFGFMMSTIGMPHRRRATLLLDPVQQRALIGKPYDILAIVLVMTAMIIGVFYCLDALHGERRDRSILFWKSLPVSDFTTVLSKAAIPVVILPSVIYVLTIVTQFLMLLWSSIVLLPSGLAGSTWARYNLLEQSLILLYGLIALVVWHAPIYGWLLVISGWAKRAAFLWFVLPLFAVSMLEKMIFNTTYFPRLLKYRLMGYVTRAFDFPKNGVVDSLSQLTPGRYLATPGLWIGLIIAAILFAVAVRLRRDRTPL